MTMDRTEKHVDLSRALNIEELVQYARNELSQGRSTSYYPPAEWDYKLHDPGNSLSLDLLVSRGETLVMSLHRLLEGVTYHAIQYRWEAVGNNGVVYKPEPEFGGAIFLPASVESITLQYPPLETLDELRTKTVDMLRRLFNAADEAIKNDGESIQVRDGWIASETTAGDIYISRMGDDAWQLLLNDVSRNVKGTTRAWSLHYEISPTDGKVIQLPNYMTHYMGINNAGIHLGYLKSMSDIPHGVQGEERRALEAAAEVDVREIRTAPGNRDVLGEDMGIKDYYTAIIFIAEAAHLAKTKTDHLRLKLDV